MTVTLTDGTRRTELWRLLTTLLDAERHPVTELIELYHRRWQAETCYFSLKSTILDGRVLRSRTVPGLEQEIYALLTVYQALIRMAGDLTTAHPHVSPQQVIFTVLLQAACDQIVTGNGTTVTKPVTLVGAIGHAALTNLMPPQRRWRVKSRMLKRYSKYPFNRNRHPRTAQKHTLHTEVIPDGWAP
ncbi:transposase [Streptomyces sp. NPDC051554]|uniref:transposase n=1 Tax=Streptomyces sp. NPDC051554 TaxID=3365656 RepID=UPI00379F9BF9